jgi:hypothetical protein
MAQICDLIASRVGHASLGAPAVRFMALAIFLTGDLLRECTLSSRTSAKSGV